jgi:hypothetical protein
MRQIVIAMLVGLALAGAASARPDAGAAPNASCKAGSKPAVIAGTFKCLKAGQRCVARNQKAYKRYGFTCVKGHLRKVARPKPPTPPAQLAQPGHYKGRTSQNEIFEFDVVAAGNAVTGIKTGQINEGCTPRTTLSGGSLNLGTFTSPVGADHGFNIDFTYSGRVDSDASTGRITITGHFNGAVAVGNLQKTTNFTHAGVQYACGSGLQTWTATRIG